MSPASPTPLSESAAPDASAAATPSGAAWSRPVRLVVVALAYFASALAALAVTGPVDGVSPIYFAAGVALACVLGWGEAMVLGILAGSVVLLAVTRHQYPDVSGAALVAVGLAWGGAAALQAWIGARLARWATRSALVLERACDILVFLVVAGPVACVVSAALSTTAMFAVGMLDAQDWARAALQWWLGDTLGVVVVTPMVLTLVAEPRELWRPRRVTVGLPMLVVTLLLALTIVQVHRWDQQREQALLARDAQSLSDGFRRQLMSYVDALEAVATVYVASDNVTRDEFHRATRHWLTSLPGVQALGWHERVDRSNWAAFEAGEQAAGLSGFRLFDRDGAAPRGPEVYAMRYAEPAAGNRGSLGLNALSVPQAAVAIRQSLASGLPVASAAFRLHQERAQQLGIVIYKVVQKPDGQARGSVFVSLRMDDALAPISRSMPGYLSACLLDVTDGPAHAYLLAGSPGCVSRHVPSDTDAHRHPPRSAEVAIPLSFGGREWRLTVWPHAPVPLAEASINDWVFAGTGVVFATALGGLLLMMSGRTRRIEEAVAERTRQLESEIGERRRTEAALRASEQRIRSIFDNAPVGVIYADMAGRIVQCNPGFAAIVARSRSNLIGVPLADLVQPDDRVGVQALFDQMRQLPAEARAVTLARECRMPDRYGRSRIARLSLQALDSDGADGVVGVVEDVTERRRLREAEEARRLAESANRAKNDFLSRMSHELRTPLNAMLGFAQLLRLDQRPPPTPAQLERVEQIERAGWHLLDMINDVLDLSRIESGSLRLTTATLDVAEVIQGAIRLMQPLADAAGVDIVYLAAPRRHLVTADETRLKQVLSNLLSNAVKYNRRGGRVRVGTGERADGRLAIEVADNGLGMNEAQLAELFQPFNRLGRERSGTEGTGIGLVISRRLVEMMGGSLEVDSLENEGTTFSLVLPLAADSATRVGPAVADPTDDLLPLAYNRRSVYYIEDNPTNAEVMRGILAQRPQVEFLVFETGAEGLRAVRESPPSLLLLDMHLPDTSGMEVLRVLKADALTADVPVVVVSADALAAQIDAALHLGALRYLSKPVDVAALLALVDAVLAEQQTVW